MPAVSCADVGADACQRQFKAETKEELVRQVARHLKEVHDVKTPTQTFITLYAQHAK